MADIALENLSESVVANLGVSKYITDQYLPIEAATHLYRIDESTLWRIMDKHSDTGFVVLSANRSEGSQFDTERGDYLRSREDNVNDYRKLVSLLKRSPYGYLPTWGGFREQGRDTINPEPSFIVFPSKTKKEGGDAASFDDLLQFGLEVARRFNQDSIMVRYPADYADETKAGRTTWVNKDGDDTDEFENDAIWNDEQQEFYTKDRRASKGGKESFKRWMRGEDPITPAETGLPVQSDDGEMMPTRPQRFSSPYMRSLGGDDSAMEESYQFYVESPSRTLNRAMARHYDGYDTAICEVLPWYRGRTGSV